MSTDDDEIALVARQHGADVPFVREASLSDDYTPVVAVVLDALHRLDPEAVRYRTVGMMMPNCPLRTAADVRSSLQSFEAAGARFQLSVVPFGWTNPWWALQLDSQRRMTPLFPEAWIQRSQDLPELFVPTGAIWWAEVQALLLEKTFKTPDCVGHCLPWSSGLDIDTEEDWALAETLLRARSLTAPRDE